MSASPSTRDVTEALIGPAECRVAGGGHMSLKGAEPGPGPALRRGPER